MSDINWHTPSKKQEYIINFWYLLDINGEFYLGRFDVETDGVGYWTIDEEIHHLPYHIDRFALCNAKLNVQNSEVPK